MTYKKKTITIENEKQEKLLKDALNFQKLTRQIGIKQQPPKAKEDLIEDIHQIEKLEKQL